MFKKLLCSVLVLALLLTFAGCKSEKKDNNLSDDEYVYYDESGEEITVDKDENNDTSEKKKKKTENEDEDEEVIITTKKGGSSKTDENGEKSTTDKKTEEKPTSSKKTSTCNHKWQDATCTKASYCSLCHETKGSPLGHDTEGEATCLLGLTCRRCGKKIADPLGHSLNNNKCTRCNYTVPEKGGTALYVGDSISCGDGSTGNWCTRLETSLGIKGTNLSTAGWSLSNIENGAIYQQITKAPAGNFDYVIMHGGVNDVWHGSVPEIGIKYGAVTPKGTTAFDTDTVAGGLEQMFYNAKTKYPNAKLGFILNYYPKGLNLNSSWSQMVQIVKVTCEKWGVPYLSFDEIENFDNAFVQSGGEYLKDGIHPTSKGYDVLTKYIADWMMTLL